MFGKILVTLIVFAFGLALIVYTEPIKRFTGSFGFAEKWFGAGGTYTFFKLFGVFLIIGVIMWATGTVDRLIPGILKTPPPN